VLHIEQLGVEPALVQQRESVGGQDADTRGRLDGGEPDPLPAGPRPHRRRDLAVGGRGQLDDVPGDQGDRLRGRGGCGSADGCGRGGGSGETRRAACSHQDADEGTGETFRCWQSRLSFSVRVNAFWSSSIAHREAWRLP
jgi:hypothetical protein